MENQLNNELLEQIYQGDYASHGNTIFKPITDTIGNTYRTLSARHPVEDNNGARLFNPNGELRKTELVGSMGGQMPTAESLGAMQEAMGLTANRYGARQPDPNSAGAIVGRTIDRMGILENDRNPSSEKQKKPTIAKAATDEAFRKIKLMQQEKQGENHGSSFGEAARKYPIGSEEDINAFAEDEKKQLQAKSGQEDQSAFTQYVNMLGPKNIQKLVMDLSKLISRQSSGKNTSTDDYIRRTTGGK